MSRPRLIALLVAVLLALGVFWYFSPYLALHAMRNAAQARDAQALAQYVDFPRVRDSLKSQLHAATERRAREAAGGSDLVRAGAAFGAMLGNFVGDRLVDAMVTPDRLAAAMREGEMKAGAGDDDAPPAQGSEKKKQWAFDRRGMNVLVAKALNADGEPDIGFVLAREGFATWRLVGIELPRG